MKTFFYYFVLPLVRPAKRMDELFNDERRVKFAALNLLIIGLLYTFTIYMGYRNGFGAVVKPFIAIPAEDYYLYELFFALPLFFLVVVLFAGCAQLLSRVFGGKGTFEDAFVANAMPYVLPMLLTMWLPETYVMVFVPQLRASELGGFGFMPVWMDAARQIIGIIWPVAITAIGIKKSQRFAWWKAIPVTVLAFIPAGTMILLFIR